MRNLKFIKDESLQIVGGLLLWSDDSSPDTFIPRESQEGSTR